jgi:hypothetical protein
MEERGAMATQGLAVDIVINNFNYGHFVCEAIESALAQDHARVNVVVVDDGSTDDSRERIARYADDVDIVLKDNGGQASALNAGFERTRGDAVIFLDADDVLSPAAAALASAAFESSADAVRVYFRMGVIDAAGRSLGFTKPPAHQRMPSGDLRRAALTFPFDFAWTPMSANAFRSAALRRICPIPSAYGRWGADWYVVHLSNLLGPVVYEPTIAAYYRMHGANAHEPRRPALDLDNVRKNIVYQQLTTEALTQLGQELGLEFADPILSPTNIAHRLISHRLAPQAHPLPRDRRGRLLRDGVRAVARRFDVTATMKVGLIAWMCAIAVVPRRVAARLAELFLYPEERARVSAAVGRLQRSPAG